MVFINRVQVNREDSGYWLDEYELEDALLHSSEEKLVGPQRLPFVARPRLLQIPLKDLN